MKKLTEFLKKWLVEGTYFDYMSLFYIVFLTAFGWIMVYSASVYSSQVDTQSSSKTHYFFNQFIFSMLGFVALYIISKFKYQMFKYFINLLIAIESVLLILVLTPLGNSVNGSSRWFKLGFISFQPSELAKIIIILYMADMCTKRPSLMKSFKGLFRLFLPVIWLAGLIAVENFSTAFICGVIAIGIYFVCTPKLKYLWIMVGGAAVAAAPLILLKGYRLERLEGWRHPDPKNNGYQTLQGLYGIGTGGLFGKGLGQSVQKLGGRIPEAHTDMIFTILCEELGIIGALALIVVFVILLFRFKFIAEGAPDRFGSLIVVGVIVHIGFQTILNLMVVTNLLPNTGVPLPFISYGGTSIVLTLFEMGMVLSVSRQIEPRSARKQEIVSEA